MRILDLNNKSAWKFSNTTEAEDGVILKSNGRIEATLSGSGKLSFKIVLKNISGSGGLRIKLLDKDHNTIFLKDLAFTSKAWTEKSLNFNISEKLKSSKLQIFRPKNSFGRLQIGRIVIESEAKIIPEKKKINKVLSKRILIAKKTQKRLAVIIPYGIYGGGEIYLKNIFSNLENPFITDFIYLAKNPLQHRISNPKIGNIVARNIPQLGAALSTNNYDLIIYYNSKRVYKALSDYKTNNKIKSEIIEIYHSNFLWPDAVASLDSRKGIDRIFRISDSLCNGISGVNDISTVPVGIDTNLFKRKKSKKNTDHRIHFGLVARLSPEKNIKYAIDLIGSNPAMKLSILGDGPMKAVLLSHIKDNNINNVELAGYKESPEDYYNDFDAFLLTSKIEGTPISILEAMSFGLPIFSTDVGEIRANFGHLDNFYFLTGDLKEDASILAVNSNKKCNFNNLREYILENHNIKLNSNLFFNLLLKNMLFTVPADPNKVILSGTFY